MSEGESGTNHSVYYSRCLNEVPLFQIPSARSDGDHNTQIQLLLNVRKDKKKNKYINRGDYWSYICVANTTEKWMRSASNGLKTDSSASAPSLHIETEVSEFKMTFSGRF